MMLEFCEITANDKEKMLPYLLIDKEIMSDRTFLSIYIWKEHYKLKKCIKSGFLFLRSEQEDKNVYYMPLGNGNIGDAVFEIYETENGRIFDIVLITEKRRKEIAECLDENAVIDEKRNEFDYVYLAENLINLSGKKYQSKRNLINRFKSENEGRWSFSEISPERDRDEILSFLDSWFNESHESKNDYRYEKSAVISALDNFDKLGFFGAKLTLNGKMIAFSLAAKQREDVMDILIEKAEPEITGAYQMINREFAEMYCKDVKYINREEDLGIEGLRKAKMSYHPEYLTHKYGAECNRF